MKLVKVDNEDRQLFTATFMGYEMVGNYKGVAERFVFSDVRDEYGTLLAEYTIFNRMKSFRKLNLKEGDRVLFYARIVYFRDEVYDCRYGIRYTTYPRFLNPSKAKKIICPIHRIY